MCCKTNSVCAHTCGSEQWGRNKTENDTVQQRTCTCSDLKLTWFLHVWVFVISL